MPTIKTLNNRDTGQVFREKINDNFNTISSYVERTSESTNELIDEKYTALSDAIEPDIGDIVFNVKDADKEKYLPCDGREIDAINYPDLAATIKDKYLFVADDPTVKNLGVASPYIFDICVWKDALYLWYGDKLFKSTDATNYTVIDTGIDITPSSVIFSMHADCLIISVGASGSITTLWTLDGTTWNRIQGSGAGSGTSNPFYYNGDIYRIYAGNSSSGSSMMKLDSDGQWVSVKDWSSSAYPRPYEYVVYAFGKYYVGCKTGSNSYKVYSTTDWSTFSEVKYSGGTYSIRDLKLLNDGTLWISTYRGSSSSSSPGYYLSMSSDGETFMGGVYNDTYYPKYFDSTNGYYVCHQFSYYYVPITISNGAFSAGSSVSIHVSNYDLAMPLMMFKGVYFKTVYNSSSTHLLYVGVSPNEYQLRSPFYNGSYLQVDASTYALAYSDGSQFLSLVLIDKDMNTTYKLHKLGSSVSISSDSKIYITSAKNRKLCISSSSPTDALINVDIDTGTYERYSVKNSSGSALGSSAYEIFMIGSTPYLRYDTSIYKGTITGSVIRFSEIRSDMGTLCRFGYLGNKVFFRYSSGIYSLDESGAIEMIGPFIEDDSSNPKWKPYEVDGVLVLSRMQCTDGTTVYGFSKNYSTYYESPGIRLFGGYYSPPGGISNGYTSAGQVNYFVYDLSHRFEKAYGVVSLSTSMYLSEYYITDVLTFSDVCYVVSKYNGVTYTTTVYKGGRLPIHPGAYIKAVK